MHKTNIAFCAVVTNVVASSLLRYDIGWIMDGLCLTAIKQS